MKGKSHSDEVSDGNEEHVIGNWRKGDACHKVTTWLHCAPSVFWKAQLVSDEPEI